MKHKPRKIKARIETLGYCAEGIGKVMEGEEAGKTVFIENTAPGDIVEGETFSHKKNYLRASLLEIIEAGEGRTPPECNISKVCGGCHWHHIKYKDQLNAKTQVIRDELKKTAGISGEFVKEIIPNPLIKGYRKKAQFPLKETKQSRRLLAGYYKRKSHEIINIKYCPVQPEIFNDILEKFRELKQKYKISVYNEKQHKGYLRHFILKQSSATNEILITIVINSKNIMPGLKNLANVLASAFDNISGITVNINETKSNVILGKESHTVYGKSYIVEKIGNKEYIISDRSFFQINPEVAGLMFEYIFSIIKEKGKAKKLMDIYAGIAAISVYLHELFEEIVAIENSTPALKDAEETFKLNNINNIKFLNIKAEEIPEKITDIKEFDWIILDPPRGGCAREVLEKISEGCANIIYVSCNPATLSRDIKILTDRDYKLLEVQPFDMFSHTYHVELIAYLIKNG